MLHIKIIIEKHEDGFVAYPLGLKGGIAGEGDSYEGALADAKLAIVSKLLVLRFLKMRRACLKPISMTLL
jgi:hypothetical protein